jgi:hypothetical protein
VPRHESKTDAVDNWHNCPAACVTVAESLEAGKTDEDSIATVTPISIGDKFLPKNDICQEYGSQPSLKNVAVLGFGNAEMLASSVVGK